MICLWRDALLGLGVTTYTFDANDNQCVMETPVGDITTYSWSYENQLIQVEEPDDVVTTNTFAPTNRKADELRIAKETADGVTHFVYDDQNIIQELDETLAVDAEYTLNPQPYGDLVSQHRDGESSFYNFDALGSTESITDGSGTKTDEYAYSAFGKILEQTGGTENPFTWVGELGYYQEADGRYLLRRREYEEAIARFLSEDPKGFDAGDEDLYGYVGNAPVNKVDPSGLEECTADNCTFYPPTDLPQYTPPPPPGRSLNSMQIELTDRMRQIRRLQSLVKIVSIPSQKQALQSSLDSQLDIARQLSNEMGNPGCIDRCLGRYETGLGDEAQDWPVAYKFFYVMEYAYDRGLFSAEAQSRAEALLSIKDDPEAMAQFVGMLAAGYAIKKGVCKAGTASFVGPLASGTIGAAEVAIALAKFAELMDLLEKSTFKSELCNNAGAVVALTTDVVLDIGFLEWIKKFICFPEGTRVVTGITPDGLLHSKSIEQIQIGDEVLSRDEFGDAVGLAKVTGIMRRKTVQLQAIQIESSTAGIFAEIITTPAHPFWVHEVQDYVSAEDLRPGQHLADVEGRLHQVVASIASTQTDSAVEVYNLEVAERHTYFVISHIAGDGDIEIVAHLVHNADKFRCNKTRGSVKTCSLLKNLVCNLHSTAFRKEGEAHVDASVIPFTGTIRHGVQDG